MAYGRASVYDNLRLPEKAKCNRCHKLKAMPAFGAKQQNALKQRLHENPRFNPAVAEFIVCGACGPRQVHELACQMCDRVKGKKEFSKAQARNPDEAICLPCMIERQNMEPGGLDSDYSSGSGGGSGADSDSDDYSDDGASTLPGTMSGMSMTTSSSGGGSNAWASSAPSSGTGGVRLSAAASSSSSARPSASTSTISSSSFRPSAVQTRAGTTSPNPRSGGGYAASEASTDTVTSRASSGATMNAWNTVSHHANGTGAPPRNVAPSLAGSSSSTRGGAVASRDRFAKVRATPQQNPTVFEPASRGSGSGNSGGKKERKGEAVAEEPDDDVEVEASDDSDSDR